MSLGKCHLCGEEKPLVNSHVIPEFLYAPLYEPNDHRLLVIPARPGKRIQILQEGLKEKLLCQDCERCLSKWEGYARTLLEGGSTRASMRTESEDHMEISNIRYDQLKLFQLSVLWRASISTLPMFSAVELGEHSHRLHNMLLRPFPGDSYEYGCIMMTMKAGSGLVDMIRSPDRITIDSVDCIRFLMGGFVWVYAVTQNGRTFPMRNMFLQERGTLVILKQNAANTEFLPAELSILRERAQDVDRISKRSRKRGR